MQEVLQNNNLAVLVHINFLGHSNAQGFAEFKELAQAAGAQIIATITGQRTTPEAKYFIGTGKASELKLAVSQTKADLVIVDHNLSPAQERNLERFCQCRVVDRTGLILDIFAQRARAFEGKLQVELAQLQYMATRLVRGWTHLERQRGGIGLRGPGESQLETDRRLIRQRLKTITQRLAKLRTQRLQNRRARQRSAIPIVALVGYTNTGKSTLFNRLAQAQVYVADQLFATLDPTLRKVELSASLPFVLADTVGFIQNLPYDLVEAFKATLEETQHADLLLHVVDAHQPIRHEQIKQVNQVLQQLKANAIPQLLIYNKIDLLAACPPRVDYNKESKPYRVWVSAKSGSGFDLLKQAIAQLLKNDQMVYKQVTLTPDQGQLRALLYKLHAVKHEQFDEKGHWHLGLSLSKIDANRLFPEAPVASPGLLKTEAGANH